VKAIVAGGAHEHTKKKKKSAAWQSGELRRRIG